MDIRPGPLSRAREHIRAYGLLDYIECRLSDGLDALCPGEAETIVIAGMGGPLMEKILVKGAGQLAGVKELIVQPQSDVEQFRKFLQEIPFTVDSEDMVEENGKYYPVMHLVCGKTKECWEKAQFRYGKYLLRDRHPVLQKYLCRERNRLEKLEQELSEVNSSRARTRLELVYEEKKCLEEAWETYGFGM